MDDDGRPLEFSNWGADYGRQGLLAPGQMVRGAVPGGGTTELSGTSFAAPIVTGVIALLLSLQIEEGREPSPHSVREALLAGVRPCKVGVGQDPGQCLAGRLDVTETLRLLSLTTKKRVSMSSEFETEAVAASCGCGAVGAEGPPGTPEAELPRDLVASPSRAVPAGPRLASRYGRSPGVTASSTWPGMFGPTGEMGLVYALGTLGYDFGTEARRDTFKQLMPPLRTDNTAVPGNPYDARQMVDYLATSPSEARALIWTLNLELTPIYAIEPLGPFGHHVYDVLRELLSGEVLAEHLEEFIQRVSVPGILSGRTARLFSGQIVPIIEVENVRGLYGWRTNALIKRTLEATGGKADEVKVRRMLDGFLNRIYYDLRNLGVTSRDRALNYAATNAFQASVTFDTAIGEGMELDNIGVEKSPICRPDSDCWDVKLKFFDPENNKRAKRVFRFTIDVSDTIPVTLGEVRTWTEAY